MENLNNEWWKRGNSIFRPRLVHTLIGKKVVGASIGSQYTVAWSEGGELHMYGPVLNCYHEEGVCMPGFEVPSEHMEIVEKQLQCLIATMD